MPEIDHIICLMMENRSYDQMLGFLPGAADGCRQAGAYEGRLLDGGIPPTDNGKRGIEVGPRHSHKAVMHQMTNCTAKPFVFSGESGYVANYRLAVRKARKGYEGRVMECFSEDKIPVMATLAKEYAVCDRWFSSVPGGTFPNRDFACAGTSFGYGQNPKLHEMPRYLYEHLTQGKRKNIFDQLRDHDKTCRIYCSSTSTLYNWPQLVMGDNGLFRNMYESHARLGGDRNRLLDDIAGGRLAQYNFVEPDYGVVGLGDSQHPGQAGSAAEFIEGERLIASIYNALRDNEAVFRKTLFVITYDEHGGYYDHVNPPEAVSPDDFKLKGIAGDDDYVFEFDRYGPRVPTILINPYIPRGTVDSTIYDHASILSTVRKAFIPWTEAFTNRDLYAKTFEGILSDVLRPTADLPVVAPEPLIAALVDFEAIESRAPEGLPLDLLMAMHCLERVDENSEEPPPDLTHGEVQSLCTAFADEDERLRLVKTAEARRA